jgi:hypothetical protein
VQFIHPGREHGEDTSGLKKWNRGLHKRKFLLSTGEYVTERDGDHARGDVTMWGEWEAESEVERMPDPVPDGPRWLHRPYYVRPSDYSGDLQNTDPFVFGETFLYTLCRQTKPISGIYRPTYLRDLAPGSLILFGSLKGGEFVLDTVLVVADGVMHNGSNWSTALEGRISQTYADVTLEPTYQVAWPHELRLYIGATRTTRVDGMFSFSPCVPLEGGVRGFARPAIRVPGVVTPGLMMGSKSTRGVALSDVAGVWNEVVSQVLDEELALGTNFALPPRRKG